MEIFAASMAGGKTNVLFVGGSNTVLKGGYYDQTVKALGDHFDLGRVDNMAIAGTTLGMGLWAALSLPPSPTYDLIFIEYCINDYTLAKKPGKFANWQWACDALLARFRQHSPEARIHTLMFGRQKKRSCPFQQALFASVRDISARHHAHPIDVDSYVHGLLEDPENDTKLYGDSSHYARPVVTTLVANYIVRLAVMSEAPLKAVLRKANRMHPQCPVELCDHRVFSSLGEVRNFKNSRYSIDAVELQADGPWQEIEIPGNMIQLNFISTRNSGRIVVAEEGEKPVTFDTLRGSAARNSFPFLICNLLFSWKKPPAGISQPRKVAMRALGSSGTEEEGATFVKQYGMYPPKTPRAPATNNVVLLAGGLFS